MVREDVLDTAPAGSDPLRRITLVANPATRGDIDHLVAIIRAEAPPECEIDLLSTTSPGEAVELAAAAAPTADIVVAIGGDGTVSDVATGLLGHRAALGIIPAGSTNIVARELRIPRQPRGAARLLFGPHRVRLIDVGICNGHCFLHMAGAGIDSHFFARASPDLKRRLGWLAYLPPAIEALRLDPVRFTISADGHRTVLDSPFVLVANGSSVITPAWRLVPGVRQDDGWLDLLVFSAATPAAKAATLARLATFGLNRSVYLLRTKARRIEIDADPRLPLQLDGDVRAKMPALIEILPKAVAVIGPR